MGKNDLLGLPEDEGRWLLRKVDIYILFYMASYPSRKEKEVFMTILLLV
jgi:hypothetical protein